VLDEAASVELLEGISIPLAIGLVSVTGLFSALLGDGAWDVLSWIGLGIPVWVSVRGLLKR
jgi:hypothetical protein